MLLHGGPLVLGHAHPSIAAAISAAALNGTSFGAPTTLETELAETIVNAVPSIEKVRLVNSGYRSHNERDPRRTRGIPVGIKSSKLTDAITVMWTIYWQKPVLGSQRLDFLIAAACRKISHAIRSPFLLTIRTLFEKQ